jgi:hypothetical protein
MKLPQWGKIMLFITSDIDSDQCILMGVRLISSGGQAPNLNYDCPEIYEISLMSLMCKQVQ